jgi:hypothetical protein
MGFRDDIRRLKDIGEPDGESGPLTILYRDRPEYQKAVVASVRLSTIRGLAEFRGGCDIGASTE